MSLVREYVAASVNRYSNVCDWGARLIAFGSCHSIGIFDVQNQKIEHLLLRHADDVRCVRWIVPDRILVSGSCDKSAVIWKWNDSGSFDPLFILTQSSPLIVADSHLESDGTFTTVTTSTDFTISLFSDSKRIASADVGRYVFDIRLIVNLSFWSVAEPVIAYSTDDSRVNLGFFEGGTLNQIISLSGHEDWSRSLDFIFPSDSVLLLASASQDGFVRVWRIEKTAPETITGINTKKFSLNTSHFLVSLETVLAGHEAAVHAVRFITDRSIITASLDKALIIWDIGEDEVWLETTRVGEVGGNNMGFLGCTFPHNQPMTAFAGYSYNGAIHTWMKNKDTESFESRTGFGGHCGEVTDISWEPNAKYLLSISSDETSRLHAKCFRSDGLSTWREIGRPQIHGYEMNCLSTIDGCSFVSGADEKVLRVFQATQRFVRDFQQLTRSSDELETSVAVEKLPLGSCVPALGLTNRAVYENEVEQEAGEELQQISPPTEETLMRDTLWPEIHKLYGHGNELFAVAVNHKKSLVVSSCKSAKAEHAGLICWKVHDDYKVSQKLAGHQLTVTSIKFSPSDKYLVSVSRDRTWCLYREEEEDHFVKVAFSDKKTCVHSRIIWDVSWTPDSSFFLTCSRDKKLVFWRVGEEVPEPRVTPLLDHINTVDHPVMSCDVLDRAFFGKFVVSFGLEDGSIHLLTFCEQTSWQPLVSEHIQLSRHHLPVRKVRFKPSHGGDSPISLASCSDDRTVQIFTVTPNSSVSAVCGQMHPSGPL